jgi:Tfp pilus assembly protein PilF
MWGRICEHSGQYSRAEVEYRAALELEPRHAPAACNLGRLLLHELDRPADALAAYESAKENLEQPQPALTGAAQSLLRLERIDEARQRLDEALALPDDQIEDAFRLVGEPAESAAAQIPAVYGQLELAAENPAAAVDWLRQAVEANPRDRKVRYALVRALQAAGRGDEAAEHARIVDEASAAMSEVDTLLTRVASEPDNADVRCRLGELLLEHASVQQGLIWLHSALQIDPAHPGAHAALAEHYEAQSATDPRFRELAEEHRRFVTTPPAERHSR